MPLHTCIFNSFWKFSWFSIGFDFCFSAPEWRRLKPFSRSSNSYIIQMSGKCALILRCNTGFYCWQNTWYLAHPLTHSALRTWPRLPDIANRKKCFVFMPFEMVQTLPTQPLIKSNKTRKICHRRGSRDGWKSKDLWVHLACCAENMRMNHWIVFPFSSRKSKNWKKNVWQKSSGKNLSESNAFTYLVQWCRAVCGGENILSFLLGFLAVHRL